MKLSSFLAAALLLVTGSYLGDITLSFSDWLWLACNVAGLGVLALVIAPIGVPSAWPGMLIAVVTGAILLICALALERVTATYVCGVWLLLVATLLQWWQRQSKRLPTLAPMLLLMAITALALSLIPPAIHRVVLELPGIAIPTHFALYEDPETVPPEPSMYYQDKHRFSPLSIALDTTHGFCEGQQMPRLRLTVVRDSNVIIHRIKYQSRLLSTYLTLQSMRGPQLHGIELAPRSDDVRLTRTDGGFVVDRIAYAEEAWLTLPPVDLSELPPLKHATLISSRLILWFLVCTVFLLWRPLRPQEAYR